MRKELRWLRVGIVVAAGCILAACNTGFGRSGNADLSRLVVEQDGSAVVLTPTFRADETEYEARVVGTIEPGSELLTGEVTIDATLDDEKATMTLNGELFESDNQQTVSLVEGINSVRVVVTAENERTKTYEIEINLVLSNSSDADLAGLDLAFITLDPEFDANTESYDVEVNYWVDNTFVIFEKSNEDASVVLGTPPEVLGQGVPGAPISLPITDSDTPETEVVLTVTSGNEEETKEYQVNVTRTGTDPSLKYFKASNHVDADDFFGSAIAIDGEYLVVGAYGEDGGVDDNANDDDTQADAGAVYVYRYTGSNWSSSAEYLKRETLTNTDSVIAAGNQFGRSVAIQGDTLIVGAPGANEVQIFTRDSGGWDLSQILPSDVADQEGEFGYSLSLEGDYLVVGAPGKNSDAGAAYVYMLDGDRWEEDGSEPLVGEGSGRFGEVVALNAYSERRELLVGAPATNSDTGAAYFYDKETDDDSWSAGDLLDTSDNNLEEGDRFGAAISISRDRIAIGASGEASNETGVSVVSEDPIAENNDIDDAGAVFLYERDSSDWALTHYFKSRFDRGVKFGSSVALSANKLAVGAPLESSDAIEVILPNAVPNNTDRTNSGGVYVYSLSGSTWSLDRFVKSSNTHEEDKFGEVIFFHGNNLVVGAPGESGDNVWPNDFNEGSANFGAAFLVR